MPEYKNYYTAGVDQIRHKGRVTTTSVTNPDANKFLQSLDDFEVDVGYVKNGFEHRPDLISELFYDTPTLGWLILFINNIDDPFEGLNVGDRILIPKV